MSAPHWKLTHGINKLEAYIQQIKQITNYSITKTPNYALETQQVPKMKSVHNHLPTQTEKSMLEFCSITKRIKATVQKLLRELRKILTAKGLTSSSLSKGFLSQRPAMETGGTTSSLPTLKT
ncbi:hypothetical protein FH972_019241 [Carpinus fangiana]|uniref:Uncharacterized protein n=1 Tax=Carpinus fangiana TaxID=176857 RepID=A0A5N6RT19_9ROSI|nr:hypothetical protein FH972_019241 [Carpinus fangiana]